MGGPTSGEKGSSRTWSSHTVDNSVGVEGVSYEYGDGKDVKIDKQNPSKPAVWGNLTHKNYHTYSLNVFMASAIVLRQSYHPVGYAGFVGAGFWCIT